MMLGHPEALVAEALGGLGEVAGIVERNPGIAAFGDRGEVEDGEWDHEGNMGTGRGIATRLSPGAMSG